MSDKGPFWALLGVGAMLFLMLAGMGIMAWGVSHVH